MATQIDDEDFHNSILGESVDDIDDGADDVEEEADEDETGDESSDDDAGEEEQSEEEGEEQAEESDDSAGGKQQGVKAAKNGDLVDAKGNVIAKAGVERRHYERAQKMTQVAQQLQEQNRQLQDQVIQARYVNKLPQALELNEQETEAGLKLMASFKKDPVKTVQTILTQARAMGHNIEVPQGIDMNAVQQMLDKRLAPLIGERQANIEQTQRVQQAHQAAAQFLAEYPDAAIHEGLIAQVLRQHREAGKPISPIEGYFKLKTWALENGYNWNQDLLDQREQRTQQRPTQQVKPSRQQAQQTKPRNVRPTANTGTLTDKPVVASSNTEWAAIINDSLKEVLKGG